MLLRALHGGCADGCVARRLPQETDHSVYSSSTIVQTSAPKELGTLREADGAEGFGAKLAKKVPCSLPVLGF